MPEGFVEENISEEDGSQNDKQSHPEIKGDLSNNN
jgi:hypothetical protein